MLYSSLAALLLLCAPHSTIATNLAPTVQNVVTSAGFSGGDFVLSGWNTSTNSGSISAGRDTSVFKSGPASLRIESKGESDGNVSFSMPNIAGKTLLVEGWIRSSGPGVKGAQFALLHQDSSYKMIEWKQVAGRYNFKDGEWAQFSMKVQVPASAAHSLAIFLLQGDGKIWLDDLTITDLTVPLKPTGTQSNFIDIVPVTNQIIAVHFKDGKIVYHKQGQKRSDDTVLQDPLDIYNAIQPGTYKISSTTDADYKGTKMPLSVGRKSKGAAFAWYADKWVGNHLENDRPDQILEHWVYLNLPKPLKSGETYNISLGSLAKNAKSTEFTFDERKSRSDSVHVNIIGYVPSAPQKFGYVYQWIGDQGGLDLAKWKGKKFWLVDQATGKDAFEGTVAFRKDKANPETIHMGDSPNGNFVQADVYECDFTDFTKPGKYVLAVEGIGCSFPFKIDVDAYREAFKTTVRGLYHNRSGIALTAPYTTYVRPAPHNPKLTPGFAGKLKYTTSRFIDWKAWDNSMDDKKAIEAGIKGPLDAWGWYQDAGDWDGYYTHLRCAQELLIAYQLAPKNFGAGELNIPESKNGLPDILNEAAWLPRFGYRLRKELVQKGYGTGGVGLRVCGDHFGGDAPNDVGRGSWLDVDRTWTVSGEDPLSTYMYACATAQLAKCLDMAGKKDPEGVDWAKEARESYAWATKNMRAGDETKQDVKLSRASASAALFVLTGDKSYEKVFIADTANITANSNLWFADVYGPSIYALGNGPTPKDPDTLKRIEGAILHTADASLDAANKRALRWGGDMGMPMLIGEQTTPWIQGLAVGWKLTERSDPGKSRLYRGAMYTTCDYFLGTNPLNQTWVTGLGAQHPNYVFHMDSWYTGNPDPVPGIIPYGPWRTEATPGPGPWHHDWANKSAYPGIDLWPGTERWFNNRCSPMSGEFTIWQNTAPAAAIFGILCGLAK